MEIEFGSENTFACCGELQLMMKLKKILENTRF